MARVLSVVGPRKDHDIPTAKRLMNLLGSQWMVVFHPCQQGLMEWPDEDQ